MRSVFRWPVFAFQHLGLRCSLLFDSVPRRSVPNLFPKWGRTVPKTGLALMPSNSLLPSLRVPVQMHDRHDGCDVAFEDEEDSEGEPADNGSSNGLRNQRELKRTRLDPSNVRRKSSRNSSPRPARSPSYQMEASRASISASGRILRRDITDGAFSADYGDAPAAGR